jgi:hypothetical protein
VKPLNYSNSAITSYEITVKNAGSGPTGALEAALSGTDEGSFTITGSPIAGIDPDGTRSFTVAHNGSLPPAQYEAVVTVSGGNGIGVSFPVSFTVTETRTSGSVEIVYLEDGFPISPEITYDLAGVTVNAADEIELTWSQSLTIQTGTVYFKTIYLDGSPLTTVASATSNYVFRPGSGAGADFLKLTPGPHEVTVYFSETQGGAFFASGTLKFRISK